MGPTDIDTPGNWWHLKWRRAITGKQKQNNGWQT